MADVTPLIGPEAKIIHNYTARGFRINGAEYLGAIMIAGDEVIPLEVKAVTELQSAHLAELDRFDVNYLIIGAARSAMLDAALLSMLKSRGIVAEVMELGAACRTFNVLRTEGRQVAAALIPAGPPVDKKA
jgi:uncharacterized protein